MCLVRCCEDGDKPHPKDKPAAYTIEGAKADLSKCYFSDLYTAYNPAETSGKHKFGDRVQFTFRNVATKVRVALYETVPGYSVKDVKFYSDDATQTGKDISNTTATLYTPSTSKFATAGTFTVSFPTVGTSNLSKEEYNKAVISFAAKSVSVSTIAYCSPNNKCVSLHLKYKDERYV